MDGEDGDMDGADVGMAAARDNAVKLQELNEMKCRLEEMEEEAAAFRDTQANVTKEMQGSVLLNYQTLLPKKAGWQKG
ncbi:unnamed protein product [Miscanthus lutarioriparius]|uniref:Uncharacterized protein n=1 Tax=Miscanthus lutarioriparius TaxID=422564 RepID=A0A811NUN2_9POAL|nr:unnamed protein product [Miscanthus lutarioriparius]